MFLLIENTVSSDLDFHFIMGSQILGLLVRWFKHTALVKDVSKFACCNNRLRTRCVHPLSNWSSKLTWVSYQADATVGCFRDVCFCGVFIIEHLSQGYRPLFPKFNLSFKNVLWQCCNLSKIWLILVACWRMLVSTCTYTQSLFSSSLIIFF